MANKKYALVAWTERGEVRMIPSLLNEMSAPYRERIESHQAMHQKGENEVGWLLARSRAHEKLARLFLGAGYRMEAYTEFERAAEVCALCSDGLWRQGEWGDFPTLPLLYRFLEMHRECTSLIRRVPCLKVRYKDSYLQSLYQWLTFDERMHNLELDEAVESSLAWRFGRAS